MQYRSPHGNTRLLLDSPALAWPNITKAAWMLGGVDSMPAVKKRLGASILLTVLSLGSIILLLPTSRVSTHLQKIGLGTTIDGSLWSWGSVDEEGEDLGGDGIRLVIFGDSWVDDTIENGQEGKGKSWGEVLCEEINCTSRLNFAASQPFGAWPAFPPTGVMTSNEIHEAALSRSKYIPLEAAELTILPDLATQIQSYIALPPPTHRPTETIFVLSFGFWDIYDFARMDFPLGQNGTDASIKDLINQLDILFNHFVTNLYPPNTPDSTTNDTNIPANIPATTPSFRIIIPKIFDPTLLPGWLTLRPRPLAPSSVAEHQKNAVYLTERWNNLVENQVAAWVLTTPKPSFEQNSSHDNVRNSADSPPASPEEASAGEEEQEPVIEKDVFYFDLPRLLLDIVIEHQLEDESLSDASGLGKGDSPFEDVYMPCVREAENEDTDGLVDLSGMLVCKEPEEYLFWDSFNLGGVVKGIIGRGVGEMVRENRTLRQQWKGTKNGAGG